MKAGRTAPSPGPCLPVLVLAGLLADALGQEVDFQPEWGFDSYEITTPKKLGLRTQGPRVARQESYLLKVKGKNRVLQLRPKRFLLPRHLRVFSFTEQGELTEDHPYLPPGCNYAGAVEEAPESEAIFSTCMGGLRGILKIEEDLYQVEPLKDSSTFEHVVYLLNKEYLSNWTCGLTDDDIEWQMPQDENMARVRPFTGFYEHPRYMELLLLFNRDRYLFVKSNASQIVSDALLLTAIVDTHFQELIVRISLQALEIWTDGDKIKTSYEDLLDVASELANYRNLFLYQRIKTDWAHLFVLKRYLHGLSGHLGQICNPYSGSVVSFPDQNILGPATWTTYELGRGMGILDDEQYCHCNGRTTCFMNNGRNGWSNCSKAHFFFVLSLGLSCLTNIPLAGYMLETCGNKIVEGDEECDCGTEEECDTDKCCQPDCKLTPGVNCSIGLCCHECQFRPSGYVCREQENECDLPEYCDGTSHLCPRDTYKQDGTPCKYKAHCFRKGCRSRLMQCQRIFGPDAKDAPIQCYQAVNSEGDQFGNCEIEKVRIYKKCEIKNALCGRIQCINVRLVPNMPDHSLIIITHLKEENLVCWGIGYHLAMRPLGIPDLGEIHDGTNCGQNRICANRTCVSDLIMNYDCLPEKCNHRGICNNKKQCHCMYGWAPPFCENKGYGGSIASGPPGPLFPEAIDLPLNVMTIMFLRLIFLVLSLIAVLFLQDQQ
ncbi:disintegrin and metalloproteinase domain-containing protein 30-like [Tenrec ecaudatus]|uniref:disintegrin and metalloproteinase domain-containing protein 30-like n=1 Tax=Tenrec ecaudatus TaxID=94439 RepID=UPI003F5A0312